MRKAPASRAARTVLALPSSFTEQSIDISRPPRQTSRLRIS